MSSTYTREQAQRDMHPHKAARFAMWYWSQRYARQGLGSMGFWDSLTDRERKFARCAVTEILAAPEEHIRACT